MWGIEETWTRSVRWVLADDGWARSDPWLTRFVDADTARYAYGIRPAAPGATIPRRDR